METPSLLTTAVIQAGAEWCGVQDSLLGEPPLLLFNSPLSGSTLAVSLRPELYENPEALIAAIKKRLAESDRDFANRTIKIKVSVLQKVAEQLVELSNTLKQMCERREK